MSAAAKPAPPRLLEDIEDRTFEALLAAGCCTRCSIQVDSGHAVQHVDAKLRNHRLCGRCHVLRCEGEA